MGVQGSRWWSSGSVRAPCCSLWTWLAAMVALVLTAEQAVLRRSWIDAPLSGLVDGLRCAFCDDFMRAATRVGQGETLAAVALVAAAWSARRGQKWVVGYLLTVGLGAGMLSLGLKLSFLRERPEIALRLVAAGGYSFPSGHSLGAMAVYGGVASCMGCSFPHMRGVGWCLSWVLIVLVGISRVYLGVHYPSDVVAGWALGGLWLAGVAFALDASRSRRVDRESERSSSTIRARSSAD